MAQVLEASGLNYEVEKRPVFMEGGIQIPNRFVTVRKSDGHPYDVVSDKFEIVQNAEAFDFVNYMGSDLQFEKAGETQSGMVYIIARLPEVSVLGDNFTPHVIFRNGFSGKVKITAAICPLRIVCQNQFNVAFREASNTVTVRHVQNAERKLEEAREVLRVSADYMDRFNFEAERLAKIKLNKSQVEMIFDNLFPVAGEDTNPFRRKTMTDARNAFIAAYDAEDNRNFKGTAWGMVNAYTDYITHKEAAGKTATKEEGKFMRVTFGNSGISNVVSKIEAVA